MLKNAEIHQASEHGTLKFVHGSQNPAPRVPAAGVAGITSEQFFVAIISVSELISIRSRKSRSVWFAAGVQVNEEGVTLRVIIIFGLRLWGYMLSLTQKASCREEVDGSSLVTFRYPRCVWTCETPENPRTAH